MFRSVIEYLLVEVLGLVPTRGREEGNIIKRAKAQRKILSLLFNRHFVKIRLQ